MSGVITSKTIRVVSRGRFVHKKGVLIGPERFWHKESTSTVKELLESYAKIEIEEKVPQSGSVVKLNLANYDKDNYRPPVGMNEPDEDPDDPQDGNDDFDDAGDGQETPETTDDTVTVENPESETTDEDDGVMIDNTPVGNDDTVINTYSVGNDDPTGLDNAAGDEKPAETPNNGVAVDDQATKVHEAEKEEPVAAKQETANNTQNNNKQNNGSSKKNKGKNKNNTEVTPKEA